MIEVLGWVPAIIFPLAALVQLIKIYTNKSVAGVSGTAWFLFGVANVCLFIYTEKYGEMQAILGMLGQSIIDFMIAAVVVYFYLTKEKNYA